MNGVQKMTQQGEQDIRSIWVIPAGWGREKVLMGDASRKRKAKELMGDTSTEKRVKGGP